MVSEVRLVSQRYKEQEKSAAFLIGTFLYYKIQNLSDDTKANTSS